VDMTEKSPTLVEHPVNKMNTKPNDKVIARFVIIAYFNFENTLVINFS
jgi:hypothetical protein